MIELIHVSKSFNEGKPNRFVALEDVSLTLQPGQMTVFKGPSGSGKTTLLSIIGCMSRPSSGRVILTGIGTRSLPVSENGHGFDISSLPERFLTEIRRSEFGFIFQQFNVVRGISALENIMLPAYPTGESHSRFQSRALELMDRFGMSRHTGSRVELLSGGELQRVAIARALINDPAVIIADEPTAHLDSRLSEEFMAMLGGFKAQGKSVLIASHDPIAYGHSLVDRVIEMRDGRILASGPE